MNSRKLLSFIATMSLASGLVIASQSFAGQVNNPDGGIDQTKTWDNQDTDHLYQLFGSIGAESLDTIEEVEAAAQTPDLWQTTSSGNSTFTLMFEIAALDDYNSFGIYDPTNISNTITLFDGVTSPGDKPDSRQFLSYWGSGEFSHGGSSYNFGAGNDFGFFLKNETYTWYSQSSLNADGYDHFVAFQGNNTDQLCIPGVCDGPGDTSSFLAEEWIIGVEDLRRTDWDYNDFVVMVQSVEPVPVPATMALFTLGLASLGYASRRKAA